MVIITSQNFQKEIIESTKPVVIDAFATWCGPCKHMEPFFAELAEQYGDKYTFAKLNVDEARDIAISYNVTSVPTFLFIKNGKVIDTTMGYMPKEELEAKILEVFGS